jgi:hypothetical protein
MWLLIEARYAAGLVGIYPDADRSEAHNSAWAASLGIEWR